MARIMPAECSQDSGERNGADGCLLCSTDAIHPTAQRPCVGWKQPAAPVPDGRLVLHGTSFIIAAWGKKIQWILDAQTVCANCHPRRLWLHPKTSLVSRLDALFMG